MPSIYFTATAPPINDFKAEAFVKRAIQKLQLGEDIYICNILIFDMLNAYIPDSLYKNISWYYEDTLLDMDDDRKCSLLWQHRVANLSSYALETLMGFRKEKENDNARIST